MKISISRNNIAVILSTLSVIIVWKILAMMVHAEIILPSPESTAIRVVQILFEQDFLLTLAGSVLRWFLAILISLLLAVIIGCITGVNVIVENVFKPYLHIIMATPVMSFILIALIWFDKQMVPVFVTFLICFPVLVNNVSAGVKNIDLKLVEMAHVYGVKRVRIIQNIYFPSILPYILSGMSTATGIGWKVVVVAEVLSTPNFSIGSKLYDAKILLETDKLFAWTLIAVILSFLFDILIKKIEKQLTQWKKT